MSQRDLAERLSTGQSVISKCESGERQLNVVEIRLWCVEGLGISWLDFLQQFDSSLIAEENAQNDGAEKLSSL